MPDRTETVSIQVLASQAISALSRASTNMVQFGTAVGKSDRELRSMDRMLLKSEGSIRNAARVISLLKIELAQAGKEATQYRNAIKTLEANNASLTRQIARLRAELREVKALNKGMSDDNQRLTNSLNNVGNAGQRMGRDVRTGAKTAARALEDLDENFRSNALRYALYDVSGTLSQFRNAGVAALGDLLGTGIAFQRDFANVIRTSQVSNPDMFSDTQAATDQLRQSFIELQSSIPVTSEELSRIGTLAAQMGIAANEVANFTEVTAKFSAASGITADEAAVSLARVGQLLASDVKGDYERLASAILKTGVNAIATEQQIVRGTTQIAAIGKVAGLSATDIVAMSSALSSLGMSPELQRSIITSSFTKILTAVRGSADEAERFGSILGMTGQEFQQAWEGDGYNTYRKLLAAIAASPNAIGILQDLGLASQRLTPNLLKVGQAYELLGETQRDTEQGWREDAELQRQYQVIMDTTAAKLQVLGQAWEGFLTIFGSGAVDLIGDAASALTDMIKGLQDFARTPAGKVVSTLVIGVALLGTGLFAVMTAVTLAGAAFLGFDFVMKQLAATIGVGTFNLLGFGFQLDATTAKSIRARIGMTALAAGAKALSFALHPITAALTVFTIAVAASSDVVKDRLDFSGSIASIDALQSKLASGSKDDVAALFSNFNSGKLSFEDMTDNLNGFSVAMNRALGIAAPDKGPWGEIRLLDEELAKLANTNAPEANKRLQELRDSWIGAGQGADTFDDAFPDTIAALSLLSNGTANTTEEIDQFVNAQEDAASAEERQTVALASQARALNLATNEYYDAETALSDFIGAVKDGAGAFFDFDSVLGDNYSGIGAIQDYLDTQLDAVQKWSDDLGMLVIRGAGATASVFAAQGPASQQAIADALALGPEALAQLEQSFADAAFFASDAYANAFAQDNAFLADVYKKALAIDPSTAMDALHDARQALLDGLNNAEVADLNAQYGLDIDVSLNPTLDPTQVSTLTAAYQNMVVTPVKIPVEMDVPGPGHGGGEKLKSMVDAYQISLNGQSIVIPVDPKTEEGSALVQEWINSESFNGTLRPGVDPKTAAASEQMRLWRLANDNLTVKVRVTGLGNITIPSPTQGATGGLMKNGQIIPGFANGTILRGPGTGTSDSILARLSNGEAVMRARAVRFYGPRMFEDINRMKFPRFNTGGGYGWPRAGAGDDGPRVKVEVTQMYPTTRDPIKKLKQDAENVLAGIWM